MSDRLHHPLGDLDALPPSPTPMRGHGAARRPGWVRPSNPGAVAEAHRLGAHRPAAPIAGAAIAGLGVFTAEDGGVSPLEGGVLPFRRTAVKPRRKRRSLWLRLLRPAATAALVVAVPSAVAWWVLTSPRFDLSEVEVSGHARVDENWVRDRLDPMLGRNLVSIPLAEVEASLQGHPWIAAVSISKRLPDGLTVEVEERRAAVLVPGPAPDAAPDAGSPLDAPLWLADAAGRPIVEAPPRAAAEFVLVVPAAERGAAVGPLADTVPGAVAVAAALSRSHPVWAAGLERIEALGQDEYRLVTTALPFPVLVRADNLERPTALLQAALPGLRRRLGEAMDEVAVADLRFADRLVLRPASGGVSGDTSEPARIAMTSTELTSTIHAGPDARPVNRVGETRRKVG